MSPSDDTTYLDLADLLQIANRGLGQVEVRDYGLLESALARPRASAFGEDAYPTMHEKAAALLSSLVRDHALVDGNKRLGWLAVRVFYGLNGYTLSAPDDPAFDLVVGIADGTLAEITKIAPHLHMWAVRS